MTTFTSRPNKDSKKAFAYFSKMRSDLDLEKYRFAKYQELFKMSSFQNMHDADLAYHKVYQVCAENSKTKESLLHCLGLEELFLTKHPAAFNQATYRQYVLTAIGDIKYKLNSGVFDYLFF